MKPRIWVLVICLSVIAAAATPAAEQAWVTRSNENAQPLLKVLAKYSPEGASQIGVDGYDEAILDLSHDTYEPMIAEFNAVIAQYRQRAATESDPRVKQDLEILIGSADDSISSARLARKYFIPFQ